MPVQPAIEPKQPAPQSPVVTPTYLAETGQGQTRPTNVGPLPSQQMSMLHDLSSLALDYADPVNPGAVTPAQQQVLDAWQQNAASDYSQYMASRGLTALAANPTGLFAEERAVAQSEWSRMDTQGAMQALHLSVADYDAYKKMEEEKHEGILKDIEGVAEIAVMVAMLA